MPHEIERKFLVDLSVLRLPAAGKVIRQGYLPMDVVSKVVVRVRVSGEQAWLTVKGENIGATRPEYEYGVPVIDAEEMLDNLCGSPLIEKTRYEILIDQHCWEIDVFHGDNEGLVVAEIELAAENEQFFIPDWVTKEVTNDPKYYNSNLQVRPYSTWHGSTWHAN